MKKAYFVLDTFNPATKKYYTVVCPVRTECDNVISKLNSWAGRNSITTCMLCDTKKRAIEVCDNWTAGHVEKREWGYDE